MAAEKKKIASTLSLYRTLKTLKQRATKTLTFVTTLNGEEDDDVLLLEIRKDSLNDIRETYFETQGRLFALIKDEEVSAVESDGEEFFDLLEEIMFEINKKIKSLSKPSDPKPSLDTSIVQAPCVSSQIKLPDIQLPRFTGQYEEWLYFRGQFNNLIRRNESLNEQQRLHYLRSCLFGEAASIETPQESFSSLWRALESRYENRRWLVDRHLAEILQFKAIAKESSIALQELVNVVQRNLRALSSLKLTLEPLSEAIVIQVVAW